jgi:hypothetical protein
MTWIPKPVRGVDLETPHHPSHTRSFDGARSGVKTEVGEDPLPVDSVKRGIVRGLGDTESRVGDQAPYGMETSPDGPTRLSKT